MSLTQEYANGRAADTMAQAKKACASIKKIIETIGPRAPGSPEELKAQEFMEREIGPYCTETQKEPFTVHRQAFMGFIPFTVLMGVIGVFLYFFDYQAASLVLCILGLIPLILEFVMYKRFIDPLFPGHESHNLICRKAPVGEVKRRIVFVGHADSQYEWTLNYLLGGNGMKAVLIPAVVGLIILTLASLIKVLVFDVAGVVSHGADLFFSVVGIIQFAFIPFFLLFLLFQNPFRSVPGANDNLTGCYVATGVIKALADSGIEFEHTEVVAICSGSEEAGLRGAKDYAQKHRKELLDTDTIVIAVDTFRDLGDLAIYDRDLSGTLKHDPDVRRLVRRAGENCGLKLEYSSIYIGASDAAAFTQEGIRATGFAAMDPTPPRYYHTRLDNWDNMNPEAIQAGIDVMVETACLFDREGCSGQDRA